VLFSDRLYCNYIVSLCTSVLWFALQQSIAESCLMELRNRQLNSGTKRQPNDGLFGDMFTIVGQQSGPVSKKFGIVPSSTVGILSDSGIDARARSHAVNELKIVIEDTQNIQLVVPHLDDLIEFVSGLLKDEDFKVRSEAIDVFAALVQKLPKRVLASKVELFVQKLCQHLGDTNGLVRESVAKTFTQMMHVVSSALVLDLLCGAGLCHRTDRVRQETINLVIIALLTFPSSDFDLPHVAKTVAIALIDERRPVRQAALECYAVLAQALGPSRRSLLMVNVSDIEARHGGNTGLTDAVNARLSNRQLPTKDSSGLVKYAAYLNRFSGASTPTPDVEWILSATSGLGPSTKSSVFDGGLSSRSCVTVSNASDESQSHFNSSRFRQSARYGLSRLPWDSEVPTSAFV